MNYLYHYSSLRALIGMLQSYEDDERIPFKEQSLLFHATDLKEMNDPNENILFESLYSYCSTYVEEALLDFSQIDIGNPYACSFSSQRDSLPMWRIYGASNDSICLVFDFDAVQKLNGSTNKQHEITLFKNCEYLPDREMNEMRESYSQELKLIAEGKPSDEIKNIVKRSSFIKNDSFSYEEEYRLALITTNPPRIKITDKGIRLYQEVLIPFSSLKQIIVGSFGNQNLLSYETQRLLDSYGINNNLSFHKAEKPMIEILKSNVRFRD